VFKFMPQEEKEELLPVAQCLASDAVYFTTRKTKDGWIAEKVYLENDELVREPLCRPRSRASAHREFRLAVVAYERTQK
jgi:hypothetical protein